MVPEFTVPDPDTVAQLELVPSVVRNLPELLVCVGSIKSTSPAAPADIAVPLPFSMPVIVVESVMTPPVTDPANPLAVETVIEDPLTETLANELGPVFWIAVPPPPTASAFKASAVSTSELVNCSPWEILEMVFD